MSLAYGVPPSVPGTIFAQALTGRITVKPSDGRTLLFGRQSDEVHICVGADDRTVSRRQGMLVFREQRWWVRNTGKVSMRLPKDRLLCATDEPVPLPEGYTALFVPGARDRQHLLEVYVAGECGQLPAAQPDDITSPRRVWTLTPEERLVLVALAQRYLLQQPQPQPMARKQVSRQLTELHEATQRKLGALSPKGKPWSEKQVEHVVVRVRTRLARAGVTGLTRDEVGEPVGNSLNHNLIIELLSTTSLVPTDLSLLEILEPRSLSCFD
ncbi:FHA domain-containing protein [Amycolatopsis nigrescens]|uniref:FHA domain-containing protein n=1 Tax=Amycolatopsis nigrescens TaxID=381445 RepID=UPI0004778FC2|nr:FHA domain-containing protein [Amycolatopsis nigrescens]